MTRFACLPLQFSAPQIPRVVAIRSHHAKSFDGQTRPDAPFQTARTLNGGRKVPLTGTNTFW
jgi:hypothetical protein